MSTIVTTLDDVVSSTDGETSLREAVAFANAQVGADTITFDASITGGLLRLTQGEIEITDAVTIDGRSVITITGDANGDDVTVSGDLTDITATGSALLSDNTRIFNITSASAETTLRSLTLTGGRADGSVAMGGTTTYYQGGAVRSLADLTIAQSQIIGNIAAPDGAYTSSKGGGVYSDGNLTVLYSTFGGNVSAGLGGGLASALVFGSTAQLSVVNSTFTDNIAENAGGGLASFGAWDFRNITVTGNAANGVGGAGGINTAFSQGGSIHDSLVVGNTDAAGYGDVRFGGNTVQGTNLIGGDATQIFAQTAQVNGVDAGVLADNGGTVRSVALLADPTNPALDASVGPAVPLADTRFALAADFPGVDNGGTRDLGAYELGELSSVIVTIADDISDPFDNETSLREAINFANISPGANLITFATGVDFIRLVSSELVITGPTIIDGGGTVTISGDRLGDDITVDGTITDVAASFGGTIGAVDDLLDDNGRIFVSLAQTELRGLTLTGGSTNEMSLGGGAIGTFADLVVKDSVIRGNSTIGDNSRGAGIFNNNGDTAVINSVIRDNVTFGDGSYGGGIAANGTLALTNSEISNNATSGSSGAGGGIFALGAVGITDSTISNNSTSGDQGQGGGIFAGNSLTIDSSTISGNSTTGTNGFGGGALAGGALILADSTVSGNSTAGTEGNGGGLNARSTLDTTNTTISGNLVTGPYAAGGGVYVVGASAFINSTLTGNGAMGAYGTGGAFAITANVELINSILIGNNATDGTEGASTTGSATLQPIGAAIYNGQLLAGGNANPITAAEVFAQTATINGVQAGVLGDNGGPVETVALRADVSNGALDAAVGALLTTADARGAAAVDVPGIGAGVRDIGAFELTGPGSLIVTTNLDVSDPLDGLNSLREAVTFANLQAGADTVTFQGGLGLIRLTAGEVEITETVTIDGGGLITITGDANGDDVTLTGNITAVTASYGGTAGAVDDLLDDNSRIFNTTSADAATTLTGLTLTGGRTTADSQSGGAVQSEAALTLINTNVLGNSTSGTSAVGGGVFSEADITLTSSTVSDNQTSGDLSAGGGVAGFGSVTLDNATISDNSTSGLQSEGGGVFAIGAVAATDTTISGNSTTGDNANGGGLLGVGEVNLTDSMVTGNSTAGSQSEGGGLRANDDLILTRTTVDGNTVAGFGSEGGGIFGLRDVTAANSTISNNSTAGEGGYGGGLVVYQGDATLTDSFVTANSTTGVNASGGGIRAINGLTLDNTNVSGNYTTGANALGGGIIGFGTTSLSHSRVANNSTIGDNGDGGGIAAFGALSLFESFVNGNATSGNYATGGGIHGADFVNVTNSSVYQNTTSGNYSYGGGVNSVRTVTLTNSTVRDNGTTGYLSSGGGISGYVAVDLTRSTVRGNTTAGDYSVGVFTTGAVSLTNSTVTANTAGGAGSDGGGIYTTTASGVTLADSLVLGNVAQNTGNDILQNAVPGGATYTGNNIVGDTFFDAGVAGQSGIAASDIFQSTVSVTAGTNTSVGGVQDFNGGPVPTVALYGNIANPALDAATGPAATSADARGVLSSDIPGVDNGGIRDLGAFEAQEQSSLIVTTLDDVVNQFDNLTSLREAVAFANARSGADTVSFDTGTGGAIEGGGLLRLTQGEILIEEALTIDRGWGHHHHW